MCCSATRKVRRKIYTVCRSGRNVKCKKHVNLFLIVNGEKRHYTAIKNISRLLSKLNGRTKHVYNYCMNCFNGFRTESARDKHYEYCSSNRHVKVNKPTEKEKRLKRGRSKAAVCNISATAHDRAYRCVEKRTRGSRKVSHLLLGVQ